MLNSVSNRRFYFKSVSGKIGAGSGQNLAMSPTENCYFRLEFARFFRQASGFAFTARTADRSTKRYLVLGLRAGEQ